MTNPAGNSFDVVQPGPMTLIQDRGRYGFQQLGVSVGGAVDIDSLDLGNKLVGNEQSAAVLEILLGGLDIEFARRTIFALTGANANATLDGVPLAANISYVAHAKSRLVLGMVNGGLRAYLAIDGGVNSPEILGSRSTHIASKIGGVEGRSLAVDDVLNIGDSISSNASGLVLPEYKPESSSTDPQNLTVSVVLGPQDDEFSKTGVDAFLNSTYTVTDQSNRQGLRLDGPEIESKSGRYDIVSDAVVNGSIQIPGDAKPIILLADRQTTGGYAKIATVATVDLPKLGQASPGARINFSAISVEESQKLLTDRTEHFAAAQIHKLADPISLGVNGEYISVGVADNGEAKIADVDGETYPVSIDEYTPAE
jgi:antagonist of KipI